MDKAARDLETAYFKKAGPGYYRRKDTVEASVSVTQVVNNPSKGVTTVAGSLTILVDKWYAGAGVNARYVAVFDMTHPGEYKVDFPNQSGGWPTFLEYAFRAVVGDRPIWQDG